VFLRTVPSESGVKNYRVRGKVFRAKAAEIEAGKGVSLYAELPAIVTEDDLLTFRKWASRNFQNPGITGVVGITHELANEAGCVIQADPYPPEDNDPWSIIYEPQHHALLEWESDGNCPSEEACDKLAKAATELGRIILPTTE
jgi:hypothetical protein